MPCVIKVECKAIANMNAELVLAIDKYAGTRTMSDDAVRHRRVLGPPTQCGPYAGSRNSDAMAQDSNCSTTPDQDSKPAARASSAKGSILIHRRFAARMDNKTHDIKLGPGPAETYQTKKCIQALLEFAAKLSPLTQLVESIYSVFLPDDFAKYKKVFDFLQANDPLLDPTNSAFGVWTSRSLVLDALSNIHRDLEDVCHGWCALVPCGDFNGGNACFPSLGAKLEMAVGKRCPLQTKIIPTNANL